MTYTLTVSSQGQVIIPVDIRKIMGITKGSQIKMRIVKNSHIPTATIEPAKVDWVEKVAGIAKGAYGDPEKYIEHERASWDKTKPWP